jgi:hypothetical protein
MAADHPPGLRRARVRRGLRRHRRLERRGGRVRVGPLAVLDDAEGVPQLLAPRVVWASRRRLAASSTCESRFRWLRISRSRVPLSASWSTNEARTRRRRVASLSPGFASWSGQPAAQRAVLFAGMVVVGGGGAAGEGVGDGAADLHAEGAHTVAGERGGPAEQGPEDGAGREKTDCAQMFTV